MSAQFGAQLEKGPVKGYIAFITYGGRNYRLMTLATDAQFAAYDAPMRSWVRSFRPLTDAARINVKPTRIKIVKLGGPMTVTAFNTRYPSVIPVDRVALLNGVAPDATFPAGKLVKQVVK